MLNKIAFSQLGRRYQYKYAEILHTENLLEKLYTDFWFPFDVKQKVSSKVVKTMIERRNSNIPNNLVKAYNAMGVQLSIELRKCKDIYEISELLVKFGKLFGEKQLKSTISESVIGMCSESLEIFSRYKENNKHTILIQYDSANDEDVFLDEQSKFPSWKASVFNRAESYYERVYKEWELSEKIIVNSLWAKEMIVKQGASGGKIEIVPLIHDENSFAIDEKPVNSLNPLKVLYVGSIVLRKGVQYLLEATTKLPKANFEFYMVGSSILSHETLRSMYPNVTFYEHVPFSEVEKFYKQCDVFVFPSLSDGFGSVQVEAMSYGMPVIATTSCGDVVEHQVSGYLVPPNNSVEIVKHLEFLCNNRDFLQLMKVNAKKRSLDFTIENLSKKFINIVTV